MFWAEGKGEVKTLVRSIFFYFWTLIATTCILYLKWSMCRSFFFFVVKCYYILHLFIIAICRSFFASTMARAFTDRLDLQCFCFLRKFLIAHFFLQRQVFFLHLVEKWHDLYYRVLQSFFFHCII